MKHLDIKVLTEEVEGKLNEEASLIQIRTANKRLEDASKLPIPKQLFDEFWVEGENAFLFADTGKGKTILGIQIADSISKGKPIPGFTMDAKPQKVLYFDFELSDKQFEKRYSNNFSDHYQFSENLLIARINPNSDEADSTELLQLKMEQAIADTSAKIIVVDNLTYMGNDNEKAKNALPLMKHIKKLKEKLGGSWLVLAHTPKRDAHRPITVNDLAGSKMLMNFCDSAFAIGESFEQEGYRYLKQVKVRSFAIKYSQWNVAVCELVEADNMAQFQFIETANEEDHLKPRKKPVKDEIIEDVIRMQKLGMSNRSIAKKHNLSEKTIRNWLSDDDLPF